MFSIFPSKHLIFLRFLRGCHTLALLVGVLYPHTPVLLFYTKIIKVAYNSETNGDGAEMSKLGQSCPSLDIYACRDAQTELRAAKPNFHRGRLAPALESRGANLRPRKLDDHLNRDVARARRVALLAPRATLNRYRHPLSYVSAITKIFGKVQKLVPHFGRRVLYSEWGRSPVGEEGVSY